VPTIIEGDLGGAAIVSDTELLITQVLEDSPATLSGLEAGDRVVTINGETFDDGETARAYLQDADPNEMINFLIVRDDVSQQIEVAPSYLEQIDQMGVGVALVQTGTLRYPWYVAPLKGAETTVYYTKEIFVAFGTIIQGFIGEDSPDVELAGPIGIAVITGEVAAQGIISLLQFAAILSINLAIINILPFPALDGGRILFVIIEGIRRKPVDEKIEAMVHNIGFLILIGLILFVTFQDILNLL